MKSLGIGHHDQITAVAYDFYGRRMATCSADHTIKVFDKVNGTWQLNDSWRAHEAPLIKLSWAGPKHTQILASASHDCTVKLWEECPNEPFLSSKRWKRRHTISDFKGPLYDIEFCMHSLSFRLAAIASDGVLRVYESIDSSNLGFWTNVFEESLLNSSVSKQLQSCFALSWSLSDNKIAVSVLDDAFVFMFDVDLNRYLKVCTLVGHRGLIRDVSWAPVFGRSYAMVATACKDGLVRVFKIVDKSAELLFSSDAHGGEVWQVSWNSSGTILASAGDDGKVRFWKSMFMGGFECMATLANEVGE